METAQRTLVLDQGYQPIKVISWQRAVTLLFLGKIEIVETYDGFLRSSTAVIKIPAVVRLLQAFRRNKKPVKFSRVNIYGRDDYRCQYCGAQKPMGELTYDHVVPRAQGGKTTWTNIVTCCAECNGRKGGRTPVQAKMKLRKLPVQPVAAPSVTIAVSSTSMPDAWRDYCYWTESLIDDSQDE